MDSTDLSFEERRRQNILDNKRILAEIGLINPNSKLTLKKTGLKRKAEDELSRPKKRPVLENKIDVDNCGSIRGPKRRSARLRGSESSAVGSEFLKLEDSDDDDDEENKHVPVAKNRPNAYGAIPGVEVGASWLTRMECCRDGIHRPTVAGIHAGPEGAYSIALSGGYDDNVDYGECFTYTGEGGRDLKGTKANPKNLRTAPQSKNQELTRGNLALSRNVETGNPVRVIRGYKLSTAFAPEEGYRYDGLYTVEKAWYTVGTSGFMVWKFALKRCRDQAPPPWEFAEQLNNSDLDKSPSKSDDGKDKPETYSSAEESPDKISLEKNGKAEDKQLIGGLEEEKHADFKEADTDNHLAGGDVVGLDRKEEKHTKVKENKMENDEAEDKQITRKEEKYTDVKESKTENDIAGSVAKSDKKKRFDEEESEGEEKEDKTKAENAELNVVPKRVEELPAKEHTESNLVSEVEQNKDLSIEENEASS